MSQFLGPNGALQIFGIRLVGLNATTFRKLLFTLVFLAVVWLVSAALKAVTRRFSRDSEGKRAEFWTKQGLHLLTASLTIVGVISIWFDDPKQLGSFAGMLTAGLAFALQRVVTELAAYFVLFRGSVFNVGDRIMMGGVRGDAIALGFIRTTIMEMGQPPGEQSDPPGMWVQARQYTGRVVRVTNDKMLDESVYNYSRDFPFIWEEMRIPVSYKDDRNRAEQILLETARTHTVDIQQISETRSGIWSAGFHARHRHQACWPSSTGRASALLPARTPSSSFRPYRSQSRTPRRCSVADEELQAHKVAERIAPDAHTIHEVVLRQGESELARPTKALAWSGLASGLSMGFSLIGEGLLHSMLPNAGWRPLIAKFGYSLGFLIVIVGKQQLFTENTLTPIIPLMHHKDARTFGNVMRLWTAVFISNLAGAHLVAWALAATPAVTPQIQQAFLEIARESMKPSFGDKVLHGIFAGWLIALLVWILGAVKSEGVAIIIILTYIVGLGGFSHVIAGSVEALFLMWAGQIGWWDAISGLTLPALIGNTIGGVSLVAALNHAQVKAGADD